MGLSADVRPRKIQYFLLIAGFCWLAFVHQAHETDSRFLVEGAQAFWKCVADGRLGQCREAEHFAVLQYLETWLVYGLGSFSHFLTGWPQGDVGSTTKALLRVLAGVSAFAGLGLIWLGTRLAERTRALWWLALMTSPLWMYLHSTFGEIQAAFLGVLFVAVLRDQVRTGWAGWFGATLLLALTKEIAAPMILVLAWMALGTRVEVKRKGPAVLVGSLCGVLVGMFWNLARFGRLKNTVLLVPEFIVSDLDTRLSFATAFLFAPNGGILWFWPALFAVGGLAWKFGERRTVLKSGLLLTILIGGLSAWWAPMGWIAWGPRLLLPWLPAIVWCLLAAAEKHLESVGARANSGKLLNSESPAVGGIQERGRRGWSQRWCFEFVFVVLCAFGLPQLWVRSSPGEVIRWEVSTTTADCQTEVGIGDPPRYFYCMKEFLWKPERWVLPQAVLQPWRDDRRLNWLLWASLGSLWIGLAYRLLSVAMGRRSGDSVIG